MHPDAKVATPGADSPRWAGLLEAEMTLTGPNPSGKNDSGRRCSKDGLSGEMFDFKQPMDSSTSNPP